MKKLLATVAIAALAAPAFANPDQTGVDKDKAAVEQPATTTEEMTTPATEATTPATDMTAPTTAAEVDNETRVFLASDAVGMKELLGAPIYNAAGKKAGRVEDFRLGAGGKAEQLIFIKGGFVGSKRTVPFSEVAFNVSDEHDPKVRVSLTDDALKSAAKFEQAEADDFWLASELVGASANLSGSTDQATISDLIVKKDGAVEYAVVQNGVVGSVGGEERAVEFQHVTIEQGDGGVAINLTPAEIEAKPEFDYRRADEVNNTPMQQ
jgi:hypothetical protein